MAPRKKNDTPLRIFVRVGALKRFHTLTRDTADLPVVVAWDRRKGERRAGTEPATGDRRTHDRRGAPPFTWHAADFVVVEEPGAPAVPVPVAVSADPALSEQGPKK